MARFVPGVASAASWSPYLAVREDHPRGNVDSIRGASDMATLIDPGACARMTMGVSLSEFIAAFVIWTG